jgi:CAAX prenyl protease-like protein
MGKTEGHGWWPYIGPYLAFMITGEIGLRLPEAAAPAMLFLKPGVTAAVLVYFWRRGAYPELRGYRDSVAWWGADFLVGVALAALWVLPYLFFPSIRPADVQTGFNPELLGAGLVPLTLAVRMAGYALVTPVFEELFMRSFVIRMAEVWGQGGDFRNVAIGHYTRASFIAVIVIFTIAHLPWEYWVMVPWAVLSTLWLYHRKHLMAVIVLHGATNGSILLFVIVTGGSIRVDGGSLPLWFFI